jgi:hypothetical protein
VEDEGATGTGEDRVPGYAGTWTKNRYILRERGTRGIELTEQSKRSNDIELTCVNLDGTHIRCLGTPSSRPPPTRASFGRRVREFRRFSRRSP